MDILTLKSTAAILGLSQSDLARAAGVSRQCISLWFRETPSGIANVQTNHLLALAKALNLPPESLLQPMPLLANPSALNIETTKLLWDKLYPDILSLIDAALDGRHDAVARIVQVFGMFASAKLLGSRVWREFPRFKRYLKSSRRIELENLWRHKQNLTKT